MKLLVTGGAGFIGSNFILYWLKKYPNDQIVNLDALTYAGNQENLIKVENNSNYSFIKGDIRNPETVKKAVKEIDIIVNFAAESHVDRSILDPAPFIMTNVVGTQVLLDMALKAKIKRFHHISTDEVFGELKLDSTEKFNENTNYDPRSPYSASKAASDHLVRAYHHSFNLPVTITNCSNNFGPYQFPEKLISLTITNLLEGKKIPVYGDGLYVRDWLHVEDHCSAIDIVLKKGKVGETYCIGAQNDLPNIEVIKMIIKNLGKSESEIQYIKDRPGHDRRYAIDSTKIKNELGWKARADFASNLKETIKWYQEHKQWWEKLKNKDFHNYYKQQYISKQK